MHSILRRNTEFWTQDRSLTALLVYIILDTFVLLPFRHSLIGDISYSITYSLILISGVFAIGAKFKTKLAIILLASVSFCIRWLSLVTEISELKMADDLCAMIFLSALTTFILWHVFKAGDITFHRIEGAVAAYVIIGLIMSKAYHLVFLLDPNAFLMPTLQEGSESFYSRFVYFSYVTLTTLGFGDITAVNLGAKSLVMIEGLIGQLYPAIMITRLVSLEIEHRRKKHE